MTEYNATYQRLGDYIREVDVRNRDLQCNNLWDCVTLGTGCPERSETAQA